jgi:cytochrome b6
MIATLFIHMFSVFFLRAYYPPREITWCSGVRPAFIVICFGFSGYLLPWNKLAFFATKSEPKSPASFRWLGRPMLCAFCAAAMTCDRRTLTRFFGFHVAVLPARGHCFSSRIHVLLVQLHGMHVPKKYEHNYQRMKFFPNFILRDLIGWILAIGVLAASRRCSRGSWVRRLMPLRRRPPASSPSGTSSSCFKR